MSDFDKFWDAVKTGVVQLAQSSLQDYWQTAVQDGTNFLEKRQEELQRWTVMLAAGELSRADFEDLVMGQADLAEMELLKQAGLAQVQVDRFVNGLLNLVIEAAVKVFL